MRKLACLLILATAQAAAQRVDGTVVDTSTGIGIPGVTVELVRTSGPVVRIGEISQGKALFSATTDAQGRFRIDDVADGTYGARYRAAQYLDASMAPSLNPPPPATFQVKAGGEPVTIAARMIHYGRMTGRLVNDKGEGIPDAALDLSSGHLTMGTNTDKDGKFKLLISPGIAYTLDAIPQLGWKPPAPEEGSGRKLAWARTYYPGVSNREAAVKITLPPGGELLDVEMKMAAVPAHAVRGVISNPDGSPAQKVAVTAGVEPTTPALRTKSKQDGTFEFPAVADGPWRLAAEVEREGVKYRAADWLEVSGRDAEGVKVHLDEPFIVPVRVLLETPEGWNAPKPPVPRLARVGLGTGPSMEPFLTQYAQPDGSFRLGPVYPGVYRFDALLNIAPPGYYLDSVRLGDSLLKAPEVPLSSGGVTLTIVYKTSGGTVRGTVEGCAGGGVVLVPQDPAMRWPMAEQTARCDAKDRYETGALKPGEYYAQAFKVSAGAEIWLPQFDENLVNQATKVTVRAGESTPVDLPVIAK